MLVAVSRWLLFGGGHYIAQVWLHVFVSNKMAWLFKTVFLKNDFFFQAENIQGPLMDHNEDPNRKNLESIQ